MTDTALYDFDTDGFEDEAPPVFDEDGVLIDAAAPVAPTPAAAAPVADEAPADADAWKSPSPLTGSAMLPTFPTHVFPDWLRAEVEGVAEEKQVPVDLPAMLALSVLSTAATARLSVRVPGTNWVESSNIYTATALHSGEGKTPTFKALMVPLAEVQKELQLSAKPEVERAQAIYDMAAKRVTRLKDEAVKADGPDAEVKMAAAAQAQADLLEKVPPRIPRLLADDATPEALTTLVYEHGRMAVLADEGGLFDQMEGRYSQGRMNLDVYLKGHSGAPLVVDRRGLHETIEAAWLSVGIAVQPVTLSRLGENEQLRGRGVVARFLFALPASRVGGRDFVSARPVPPEVRAEYEAQMGRLVRDLYSAEPVEVGLMPDAIPVLHEFQRRTEKAMAFGGPLEQVRDWGSKLPGQTLRLALLLHLAEHGPSALARQVSADTLRHAVEVADYLVPHFLAVVALMEETREVRIAKRILTWVARNGQPEVSQRDIHRGIACKDIATVDDLAPGLRLLTDRNWLAEVKDQAQGPGRKSTRFKVNPALFADGGLARVLSAQS